MIKWPIGIALLALLSACREPPQVVESKEVMPMEYISMPKAEEIPRLKEKALSGSKTAALQLSLWHMKFPVGSDTSSYWDRIAAENGSAVGQFNLGVWYLSDESDHLSKVRAKYWFTKSAEQGSAMAKERLAQMENTNRTD